MLKEYDFADSVVSEAVDGDTLPAELLEELEAQLSTFGDRLIEVQKIDFWGTTDLTPL
jgi:hypothetical protein